MSLSDGCLFGGLHHDGLLATILSAVRAYAVANVPTTAVRTDAERGHRRVVVRATFAGTRLGLSSFRMCHNVFMFFLFL